MNDLADPFEVEPEPIAGDSQEYADEAGEEPEQERNWLAWILGGVVVVSLIVAACCITLVLAYYIGQSARGETPPAITPTPTAGQIPSPVPTEGPVPGPSPTEGVPPQAVINYPAEAKVGEEVTFDGSGSRAGSSPIASYDWDFGEGSKGSGAVVTHVYNAPGAYKVTLMVTAQDGLSTTGGPVEITIQPAATPEPGPTPLPPQIDSFSVLPEEIKLGECVDIDWSTSGATSWVNILRSEDFIWENAPLSGSIQDCPNTAGEYRYRIVAYNPEDDRVREDQRVTVNE
jgi:PKD repeat protein